MIVEPVDGVELKSVITARRNLERTRRGVCLPGAPVEGVSGAGNADSAGVVDSVEGDGGGAEVGGGGTGEEGSDDGWGSCRREGIGKSRINYF